MDDFLDSVVFTEFHYDDVLIILTFGRHPLCWGGSTQYKHP